MAELEVDRSAHVSGALALRVSVQPDVAEDVPGPDLTYPAPLRQQGPAEQPVRMAGWRIIVRRQA